MFLDDLNTSLRQRHNHRVDCGDTLRVGFWTNWLTRIELLRVPVEAQSHLILLLNFFDKPVLNSFEMRCLDKSWFVGITGQS